MNKILILNGPNLNILEHRPQNIYGTSSYQDLCNLCLEEAQKHKLQAEIAQTNIEGEIVNIIQKSWHIKGIIINPAAYSHTSIAIYDALETFKNPIIEVHLTNIYQREEYRQPMITAKAASGVISGFGIESYRLAIIALAKIIKKEFQE